MDLLVRVSALAALAVAAFIGVGCGGTVIDDAKTESAIEQNLEDSVGQKVASVECPSDVEVEAKTTFQCDVRLENGEGEKVTLRILNEDADIEVANIQPEKSAGQPAK